MVNINAAPIDLETKKVLLALLAETTALRAANTLLLAKLDADAGVTDTDYAATCAPAAAAVAR